MKTVFDFKNYKDYLKTVLHSKSSPRGMQSALAKSLKCQPAYLYQVLRGKGHLTDDQAFNATLFFKMSEREQNYFLLSVRLAKAASLNLQNYLKEKMTTLLKEELDLKNKSDSFVPVDDNKIWNYYFSSSIPSAIHLLTSSEKFQTSESIAKKLNTSNEKILTNLEKLSQLGFVNFNAGKWHHSSSSVHFDKNSSHNLAMQVMRRSQALASLYNQSEESVHFSSAFTLDKTSYDSIRMMVSEFVEKAQKTIHNGGAEEYYIMSIDLFSP